MEKINIAELLKDCPKGMELDCTMFDDVTLLEIIDRPNNQFPIKIAIGANRFRYLTETGGYDLIPETKCVIFPKGKTTWEGFVPPCKFKNGDILYIATNDGKYNLCMVDCIIGGILYTKTSCSCNGYFLCTCEEQVNIEELVVMRFATEEEKAKLFQEIKDNGYKWDPETKTLEKITEPSFEVGNRVRLKDNHNIVFTITSIAEDHYVCGAAKAFWFMDQDKFELVPDKYDISTLKPFESRVLVRDSNIDEWGVSFWGCLRDNRYGYNYDTARGYYKQCIPYENNEYLLGKTEDCKDFYKTWE